MSFSYTDANSTNWWANSNGTVGVNYGGSYGFDTGSSLSLALVSGSTTSSIYTSYTTAASTTSSQSLTASASSSAYSVTVQRDSAVLSDGSGHYYLRLVETVTNTGAATATFRATLSDNFYTDSSTALVQTSSGDTTYTRGDDWYVTNSSSQPGRPSFAHVVSGGAGSPTATSNSSADQFDTSYDLTLAAGASATIVHFVVAEPTSTQAAALSTTLAGLPTSALAGLSATQLASLTNFIIDVTSSSTVSGLTAYQRNLTLTGSAAINGTGNSRSNVIIGNGAANRLTGLGGNDTLDGRGGADTLDGGTGNDTYVVDNAGDSIIENSNAGIDTVQSSISFSLAALPYLENLTLTGSAAINGTGNSANNILTGNRAANKLSGGTGNDTLDGKGGADTLTGGAGNDKYYVDTSKDTVVEGSNAGTDTVYSTASYSIGSLANVENITLLGSTSLAATGNSLANILTGNAAGNKIRGGAGNDKLDGKGGSDVLVGDLGNDIYYVDRSSDVVTEAVSQGTDTVYSSAASYTLSSNVENLILQGGVSVWRGIGNSAANRLTGNSTDNYLDGGAGGDTLTGGRGSDTYVVDNSSDSVVEASGAGVDTVISKLSTYTLGSNVENGRLAAGASNMGGNSLNNSITGNSAANAIAGGNGNDTLSGGGQNDTLNGGNGDDILMGDDGGPGQTLVTGEGTSNGSSVTLNISAPEIASGVVRLSGTISTINLTQSPINITYVIDHSGSMSATFSGDTTIGDVNSDGNVNTTMDAAIASFKRLNTLIAGTGLGSAVNAVLIPFDDTASVAYSGNPGTDADGNGVADIVDALSTLTPGGGTDYTTALQTSVDWLGSQTSGTNVVFFVSDGEPNSRDYETTVLPSLWALGRGGAIVRAIGTGTGANESILDYLDDGLDNNSAEIVTDPDELQLGLSSSLLGTADGAWVEIYKNNTLVKVIGSDGFTVTPFGLQFSTSLALSASGTDTFRAVLVTSDAAGSTVSTSVPIRIGSFVSDDALIGGAGNDILDGGFGADAMRGGLDNDTYYIDNAGDRAIELDGEGTDTVITTLENYTLGNYIENLTLSGSVRKGIGNSAANEIRGNAANNALYGSAGNDTLHGGAGNDTLDGGTGNDWMDGGTGNDIYVVDSSYDDVNEATDGGIDAVTTAFSSSLGGYVSGLSWSESFHNIENLSLQNVSTALVGIGSSANNRLVGNSYTNTLYGLEGNDYLDGGAGYDTMDGGTGNDSYVVRDSGDVVIDGSGVDTVVSYLASYTLGATIENLTLAGTSTAITGIGNKLNNVLVGNAYANKLNGGAGSDTMKGGRGDDVYYVNGSDDLVVEDANAGTDTVISTASHLLGANVENLSLSGSASIAGAGNTLANAITGNDGNNRILGLAGQDKLVGGAGNDTLIGGVDADTLTGGTGADRFVYSSISESKRGSEDTVRDFVASQKDIIDLSGIDANSAGGSSNDTFVYRGTSAFTGFAGQLRFAAVSGGGLLQGDVNGDGTADFSLKLTGVSSFSASSLVL